MKKELSMQQWLYRRTLLMRQLFLCLILCIFYLYFLMSLAGKGTGSSYIAELYQDFGYIGIFLGNIFYSLIIARVSQFKEKQNILGMSVRFYIITQILWATRGSYTGFISNLLAPSTIICFIGIFGIAAKFVTPVTNMLLARILTPDAFGVLAICNMLVSFVDIITDAGFGKYLIQHDFIDDREKHAYTNVAFWSNLTISLVLFLLTDSKN